MGWPFIVWIVLAFIWGSTWLCIKIGLEDMPPFTFGWLRFVVALVPLLILMRLRGKRFPRKRRDWQLMAITGFLTFTINYALIYWGENYINSGLAAVLYSTLPLFGLVLAHRYIIGESISAGKLAGVLLGIMGVAVIFYGQFQLETSLAVWGAVAIVGASLATACASTIIKKYCSHMDVVVLTTGQILIGVIPLGLLGLIVEGNPFARTWSGPTTACLFYLGVVGTAVTFAWLNWLIKRVAVTKTQLIPFASTLIAVGLGWLVRDEVLHLRTALGTICILVGLVLTSVGKRRRSIIITS